MEIDFHRDKDFEISSLESLTMLGTAVSDEELDSVIKSVTYNAPCFYANTSVSVFSDCILIRKFN